MARGLTPASEAPRVLVIDDEDAARGAVATGLREAGCFVMEAADGPAGLDAAVNARPDIVVLDLMLPGLPGERLLQQLRTVSAVPVIVVSAKREEDDRVTALDLGADDYLVKPFAMEELLARLRAVLRRTAGSFTNVVRYGCLILDPRARRLTVEGTAVSLTPLEFRLLAYLLHHVGRVVPQAEIAEHLYADDRDRRDNAIEATVGRLRRKIGGDVIQTRRGHGYVIEPLS